MPAITELSHRQNDVNDQALGRGFCSYRFPSRRCNRLRCYFQLWGFSNFCRLQIEHQNDNGETKWANRMLDSDSPKRWALKVLQLKKQISTLTHLMQRQSARVLKRTQYVPSKNSNIFTTQLHNGLIKHRISTRANKCARNLVGDVLDAVWIDYKPPHSFVHNGKV